jgi:regulator of protease activity HflC (stomatin/prohibitin superfamily)
MDEVAARTEQLEKHDAQLVRFQQTAESIVVSDDETLTAAAVLVKEIRSQVNAIETERKELVKPFNDGVKAINTKAKAITMPLNELRTAVEQKMIAYQDERRREEERKRKEAEEKALAEAAKAEAEGEPEKADAIVEVAAQQTAPPKTEAVKSAFATTSVRKTWTFSVENLGEVPRQYMVLDVTAVRAAIKSGVREIPGLKIYEERKTLVR